MKRIKAIRGMNDILPDETPLWQYLEKTVEQVLHAYGYQEIRFPIVEQTQLFKRSIGEVTDIVEKEMYSFVDRNGDELSLRPEGTASCVRAAEEHGLLYNQQQRFWYQGPMFRHERPQKGRYRQFHQVGVEAFGMAGPDIDAEIIRMTARLWRYLGIADRVRLEINNIGTAEDRRRFGEDLSAYLRQHLDCLDEDSRRRLDSNPLRILDSKDESTRAVLEHAPRLIDYVAAETREHYEAFKRLLELADIAYVENPALVRGLDYYNNAVFEWTTDTLGAQGTICAGGRYDSLVAKLGGRDTPATGFAIGMERLVLMLENLQRIPAAVYQTVDVYLVTGRNGEEQGLALAEWLRDKCPGLRVVCHCGGGKYNARIKKAYNSGARAAVILDDAPAESSAVKLRWLDRDDTPRAVTHGDLVEAFAGLVR